MALVSLFMASVASSSGLDTDGWFPATRFGGSRPFSETFIIFSPAHSTLLLPKEEGTISPPVQSASREIGVFETTRKQIP